MKGNNTAYVSSQRDREVDVVTFGPGDGGLAASVTDRIAVQGQPNKIDPQRRTSRGSSWPTGTAIVCSIIDTGSNTILETIQVLAPTSVFANTTRP